MQIELHAEINELRGEVGKCNAIIKSLTTEVVQLRKALDEAELIVNDTETALRITKRQLVESEKARETHEADRDLWQRHMNDRNAVITDVTEQVVEQQTVIEALTKEYEQTQQELDKMSQALELRKSTVHESVGTDADIFDQWLQKTVRIPAEKVAIHRMTQKYVAEKRDAELCAQAQQVLLSEEEGQRRSILCDFYATMMDHNAYHVVLNEVEAPVVPMPRPPSSQLMMSSRRGPSTNGGSPSPVSPVRYRDDDRDDGVDTNSDDPPGEHDISDGDANTTTFVADLPADAASSSPSHVQYSMPRRWRNSNSPATNVVASPQARSPSRRTRGGVGSLGRSSVSVVASSASIFDNKLGSGIFKTIQAEYEHQLRSQEACYEMAIADNWHVVETERRIIHQAADLIAEESYNRSLIVTQQLSDAVELYVHLIQTRKEDELQRTVRTLLADNKHLLDFNSEEVFFRFKLAKEYALKEADIKTKAFRFGHDLVLMAESIGRWGLGGGGGGGRMATEKNEEPNRPTKSYFPVSAQDHNDGCLYLHRNIWNDVTTFLSHVLGRLHQEQQDRCRDNHNAILREETNHRHQIVLEYQSVSHSWGDTQRMLMRLHHATFAKETNEREALFRQEQYERVHGILLEEQTKFNGSINVMFRSQFREIYHEDFRKKEFAAFWQGMLREQEDRERRMIISEAFDTIRVELKNADIVQRRLIVKKTKAEATLGDSQRDAIQQLETSCRDFMVSSYFEKDLPTILAWKQDQFVTCSRAEMSRLREERAHRLQLESQEEKERATFIVGVELQERRDLAHACTLFADAIQTRQSTQMEERKKSSDLLLHAHHQTVMACLEVHETMLLGFAKEWQIALQFQTGTIIPSVLMPCLEERAIIVQDQAVRHTALVAGFESHTAVLKEQLGNVVCEETLARQHVEQGWEFGLVQLNTNADNAIKTLSAEVEHQLSLAEKEEEMEHVSVDVGEQIEALIRGVHKQQQRFVKASAAVLVELYITLVEKEFDRYVASMTSIRKMSMLYSMELEVTAEKAVQQSTRHASMLNTVVLHSSAFMEYGFMAATSTQQEKSNLWALSAQQHFEKHTVGVQMLEQFSAISDSFVQAHAAWSAGGMQWLHQTTTNNESLRTSLQNMETSSIERENTTERVLLLQSVCEQKASMSETCLDVLGTLRSLCEWSVPPAAVISAEKASSPIKAMSSLTTATAGGGKTTRSSVGLQTRRRSATVSSVGAPTSFAKPTLTATALARSRSSPRQPQQPPQQPRETSHKSAAASFFEFIRTPPPSSGTATPMNTSLTSINNEESILRIEHSELSSPNTGGSGGSADQTKMLSREPLVLEEPRHFMGRGRSTSLTRHASVSPPAGAARRLSGSGASPNKRVLSPSFDSSDDEHASKDDDDQRPFVTSFSVPPTPAPEGALGSTFNSNRQFHNTSKAHSMRGDDDDLPSLASGLFTVEVSSAPVGQQQHLSSARSGRGLPSRTGSTDALSQQEYPGPETQQLLYEDLLTPLPLFGDSEEPPVAARATRTSSSAANSSSNFFTATPTTTVGAGTPSSAVGGGVTPTTSYYQQQASTDLYGKLDDALFDQL